MKSGLAESERPSHNWRMKYGYARVSTDDQNADMQRTGAGREAAKQRGVRFGRPRKRNTDQAQVVAQLLVEGKAVRDIARTFNVHEATIYRLAATS
jgi:DNA invertase Pin-like site-specific DNA recombinase